MGMLRKMAGGVLLLCVMGVFVGVSRGQGGGTIYLPIVANMPTLVARTTPVPTDTPLPTATATPVNTVEPTATLELIYICDHDAYNCPSFTTQAAAQQVHDYCEGLGFGDIHRLDGNNDNGLACESLP